MLYRYSVNKLSRKYHDRVASNLQDLELLLHFALAKGQQYQATPIQTSGLSHQVGEKICSEALKCFTVGYLSGRLVFNTEYYASLGYSMLSKSSKIRLRISHTSDLSSN